SSAIFSTVMAFISPGDEVLLLDPCYSLYEDAVRVAGGVAVRVKLTPDFHIDEALLEQAVTPRSKMLIICSPCNPTALLLTRAELEAVERVAAKYDFLVVSDEVYHRIVYDGREFISVLDLPELSTRALLLQSFSKSYAMTGWRLGYIAARGGLSKSAAAIQRTAMGAINGITQRAGLAVMRAPRELADPWFREMLGVYERRRRIGQALFDEMPKVSYHLPEATFYYWVKVDTSLSSVDLIGYLRREARVALHSGTEYGPAGEGYLRFSYAAPDEDFREGLTRVGEALTRLDR
ncbi:MAG: aminotransferase class I/II-fold pyridoxal phosphate-dependent enzyme, partial [Chloroflexi bacterium]|nr:aminotransferase class I/II-fold pyridoxal phosphate-dependent enzyme [Chloroflexota bacterium]